MYLQKEVLDQKLRCHDPRVVSILIKCNELHLYNQPRKRSRLYNTEQSEEFEYHIWMEYIHWKLRPGKISELIQLYHNLFWIEFTESREASLLFQTAAIIN